MKIYNICLKTLVLFCIFYTGVTSRIPLINKNICKQIKDNKYIPFKKKIIHYGCTVSEGNSRVFIGNSTTRGGPRKRRLNNPYVVFAKDILRKYVYIFNVVVIYVLLNT
jgi:hypothetical protein